MSQPDTDRNPVEVLAEEFATRVRNGETPSVQQYADQYPELADEINELFPSIAMMEAFGSREHAERNAEKSQAVFAATPIEQLGDFRIVRQIGRGGMGVVYEAEQESLGRHVAVKVLGSNAVSSPRQLQRFHREAHAAASLHHTNIVPIFGVGQHDEVHYYVMQLIDGVGLEQIIQELSQNAPAGQSAAHSEGGPSSDSAGSARAAAEALCNGDLVAASRATALSNAWSPTSPSNESKSPPESKLEAAAETIVREIPRLSGDATSDANTVCPAADGETVVVQRSETEANRSEDKSRRRELGDRYWKSVAKMGVQLADALEYAHTQNVLHRDIKPSNLLLDRQGTVWITDFGLAKHTESHDLTNTGDIVGTLRYMAPEQFNGRYNAQSDLYNLGVTLYELITLQPAFGESQQGILIQKITSSESPSPRSINPAIPRDLETIVLKATANEPSRRYASAGELADDLQRFLDDMPIRARRVTLPERIWRWSRRNPALAMASGSALMLLVLVAVVALWGNIRTNQALERVSKERDNVRMAKEEAERASNSAEENLAFAIETFRNIVSNIASRGAPASLDIELEEGETPPHEMALTEGDAQLLTNLVEFFEEFARNNQSDLREETAEAYRSVGEIRRRLGQFDDSVAAYNKALQIYQQLAETGPTVPNVIMQAKTMNEIGQAHRDQGDFLQAMRAHEKAKNVLRRQPDEIADDRRCRFELVKTYLAQASFWEPSGIISQDASTASDTDRRSPPPNREDEHPPDHRGDDQRERSPDDDRERRSDRSRNRDGRSRSARRPPQESALDELQRLIADEPDNPEYRLAQARAYRLSMRFEFMRGGHENAQAALVKSIGILNELVDLHPQEVSYKVELVETLLQTPVARDGSDVDEFYADNIQSAAVLAEELATTFPLVHQYAALLAGSQRKLGAIAQKTGDLEQAENRFVEAVDNLSSLVDRYPTITVYQIALAQSRQGLGDLKREQGNLKESLAQLEIAVDSFEIFRAERRFNPFYHRMAGSLYDSMAETLKAMGDLEQAVEYRNKAQRLHRPSWRGGGRGGRNQARGASDR